MKCKVCHVDAKCDECGSDEFMGAGWRSRKLPSGKRVRDVHKHLCKHCFKTYGVIGVIDGAKSTRR